jgi:propanol-preferring alcohol dehydrogenase
VYKGLKMTGVRPGEWVTISGIGGLGHIAVQYARAMGMRVAAVDVDDAKLELARRHGAEVTVNAAQTDPGAAISEHTGGTHGVLVTAVHPGLRPGAQRRAAGSHDRLQRSAARDLRRRHLRHRAARDHDPRIDRRHPPGHDRGARLLRPRSDPPTVHVESLEDVNDIFERMEKGQIDGRIVMRY